MKWVFFYWLQTIAVFLTAILWCFFKKNNGSISQCYMCPLAQKSRNYFLSWEISSEGEAASKCHWKSREFFKIFWKIFPKWWTSLGTEICHLFTPYIHVFSQCLVKLQFMFEEQGLFSSQPNEYPCLLWFVTEHRKGKISSEWPFPFLKTNVPKAELHIYFKWKIQMS